MEKVGAYTDRATEIGEWRAGNPGLGQQATPMLAAYFNMLQRELVGVVEAAGLVLDDENDAQLLSAIRRLRGGAGNTGLWNWSVSTGGNPGSGRLSLNNAAPAAATQIIIAESSAEALDYSASLGMFRAGDTFSIQSRDDATFFHRYRLTGISVDEGSYRTLPVAYVGGSGAVPADGLVLFASMGLANATDSLNTARVDVASAAAVNLTAGAPSTRSINITGTTAITSFTVAAGQLYFVRFNSSLTLTASASLVTQSGGNIVTQPGDTCILRATANNVVEVLCYAPGIRQEMGYGQTWQGLTALRALNTTYTNTTGRTIAISVTVQVSSSSGGSVGMMVNGLAITRGTQSYLGSAPTSAFVLVPPGATYTAYMNSGSGSISDWQELR